MRRFIILLLITTMSVIFISCINKKDNKENIVISDTKKAFQLLRSGGIIMWHDFCPPIYDKFECTLEVMRAIHHRWEWIDEQTSKLFWIYPSWILLGVKK